MVADVIGLDGLISIKEYLTITMNAAVRKIGGFCGICAMMHSVSYVDVEKKTNYEAADEDNDALRMIVFTKYILDLH